MKDKTQISSPALKKTTIGGQALIEGLLMLGPSKQAIALRAPSGEITVTVKDRSTGGVSFNVPFLRGVIRLVTQLKTGIGALTYSAEVATKEEVDEDEPPSRLDRFAERHPKLVTGLTLLVSLSFSIALFILLPSVLTDFIRRLTGYGLGESRGHAVFLLSLLEGVIRIALFLFYMWITARSKEIKRVWGYHGAEHKTIACYEAGLPLTVDNVRMQSRFHPRCGTSFIFLVMIVAILIFSVVGRYHILINLLIRLALLPVVAGISYEIIRLAGAYDNFVTRMISSPGLALQRLTTAEPDDSMIEVAIASMEPVIPEHDDDDRW